jgi:outer membrane PBP1 activator LpoA protein
MRSILLAVVMLVSACAHQGPRRADMPWLEEAESRIAANDFAGAAEIYQRLADESDSPDYYRLLAADAELKAGNARAAQGLIGGINADELSTPDWYRYVLLRSRMDLNRGDAREAMARLDTLNYQRLDPDQAAHYHTLRASAYNQLGNMMESARERVELGALLTNQKAVNANNDAIYDTLNRLPDRALSDLQPPPPDVLGGWMALTQILRGPRDQRETAIRAWRSRYLGHPADGAFLEAQLTGAKPNPRTVGGSPGPAELAPSSVAATTEPLRTDVVDDKPVVPSYGGESRIGVLLPLSGSFAAAGQAVRTGLEAAHSADTNPQKPTLQFADTNGADPAGLYRQLVEQGASQIIGPLMKDDIATIARSADVSVPMLALNQNADVNHERVYQFGLTPEQEVDQAAGSAWFDGWHSAAVLAPASAFGQRMINRFSSYWRSLGGRVLAVKTYQAGGNDFSAPTKQLLDAVAAGGNTADFVFLVADPRDGGLLKPYLEAQLNNHAMPVYATSHIFNGRADVPQSPDLSGIIFCDIPWLLKVGDSGSLSTLSLRATLDQTSESYRRLIAMGIDAYRLLPELSRLAASPQDRFDGETGVLTIAEGNRIQRQLQCAQFEAGGIQSRGIAPLLKPGAPGQDGSEQAGESGR